MLLLRRAIIFLTVALAGLPGVLRPQNANQLPPAAAQIPTAEQIIAQMQRHNQQRTQQLLRYHAVRHYQAEYQGFATKLEGALEVEVNYNAASGKSFRILSESGSKLLCEKVLKRAVESEKEASRDSQSTALTAANYKFHLAGIEDLAGRPAYILDVEPLVPSKFLYEGKIWVDAVDFALAKIEAKPAKSPSFWISRTTIHQSFAKTGIFWFPQHNRSDTKVRIGGAAIFNIDYGTYQIESKTPQE